MFRHRHAGRSQIEAYRTMGLGPDRIVGCTEVTQCGQIPGTAFWEVDPGKSPPRQLRYSAPSPSPPEPRAATVELTLAACFHPDPFRRRPARSTTAPGRGRGSRMDHVGRPPAVPVAPPSH